MELHLWICLGNQDTSLQNEPMVLGNKSGANTASIFTMSLCTQQIQTASGARSATAKRPM